MPGAEGRKTPAELDLAAIEATLRAVQRSSTELEDGGDPFDDEVIANMMVGYGLVNSMLAQSADPFSIGNSKWLLELNFVVLCGHAQDERERWSDLLTSTSDRFYDPHGGDVASLVEWVGDHRKSDIWTLAAGTYARVISHPQLFVEGNHRTASLIVSLMLGSKGAPPFVLSPSNVSALISISNRIEAIDKRKFFQTLRLGSIVAELALLIRAGAREEFLKR
jgi:hypothetical protein